MTLENRFVATLEDVRAVVLECADEGCGARLSCSPDKPEPIPATCPKCRLGWLAAPREMRHELAEPSAVAFAKSLARLRALPRDANTGFRILLEFDVPK